MTEQFVIRFMYTTSMCLHSMIFEIASIKKIIKTITNLTLLRNVKYGKDVGILFRSFICNIPNKASIRKHESISLIIQKPRLFDI